MSNLTEIANKLIEATNCSTDEAIRALEQSGGDYVKAINILVTNDNANNANANNANANNANANNANANNANASNSNESSNANSTDDSNSKQAKEEYVVKGKEILKTIKKLIEEGNIAKISIKKDGETILNIPVNAAAVGIILLPFASMIAGIAAIATDCTIEVQRKGNVVVNVNDKLKQAGSKVEKAVKDILEKKDDSTGGTSS